MQLISCVNLILVHDYSQDLRNTILNTILYIKNLVAINKI